MSKVPFKYNPSIVKDIGSYPWQLPDDKYAVKRKMLREDLSYSLADRTSEAKKETFKKQKLYADDTGRVGWMRGISLDQMYSNYAMTGAIPMRAPGRRGGREAYVVSICHTRAYDG